MIVEQDRDERMRIGVGLVDPRQLDERGTISFFVPRTLKRVPIALTLVKSAQRVLQ